MKAFTKQPIGIQLASVLIMALLIASWGMVTAIGNRAEQSAIQKTQQDLKNQVSLMSGSLQGLYESVKERGKRQAAFYANYTAIQPTLGEGKAATGNIELPLVMLGAEPLNGNLRPLEVFKKLTGDEASYVFIHEGKVYRLATLLKNSEGQSMNGTEISSNDPLAKALLSGQDYQGLTIRNGKYNFSTMTVLKDQNGKPWIGYVVRISLEQEIRQLREQFGKVIIGNTGKPIILRKTNENDGEYVLHTEHQDKDLNDPAISNSDKEIAQAILKSQNGEIKIPTPTSNGDLSEKLMYVEEIPGWNWKVAAGSWTDEFLEETRKLESLIFYIGLFTAFLLSIFSFILIKNRLGGLEVLAHEVHKLSQGDLRAHIDNADEKSRNEVHRIACSFNDMSNHIRVLLKQINDTSSGLTNAASELQLVVTNAKADATTSSEAASSIAASVEELSVSISHVASSADEASAISTKANIVSASGKLKVVSAINELEKATVAVKHSSEAIDSLGNRSQQIYSVIAVIRDIAEQTNLLALNAAIEAARAGETGRGFAVVADEVRKLSERTAQSTSEISRTIQSIIDETASAVVKMQMVTQSVNHSVSLAQEAGGSLHEIDQHSQQAADAVQIIADSTREQSVASQEIARFIERIAQLTDAANFQAEKSSIQAQQLRTHAESLRQALMKFQF